MPTILWAVCGCADSGSSLSSVPAEWVEVDAGSAFSLTAPPGTRFSPGDGKDSFIGSFEAAGLRLSFDYGLYSNPLVSDGSGKNYTARNVDIDGKKAKIVTNYIPHRSTKRPYFIGVYFQDVGKSSIGTIKLTVHTSVERKEDYDIVEKIFGTIRFK